MIRIALGQMDVTAGRPEVNMGRAEALAAESARQGAQILLLPELWLTGYDLARAEEHARTFAEGFQGRWAALARSSKLYLAGSVLARDPAGRPANTAMIISPQGKVIASYRKIHLFGPMEEPRYLAAGDSIPSFDLPWGPTALAVCYDLRFPELFRRFVRQHATLIMLPAQWPLARIEHWRVLLRARAIENQCFMVACNRIGRDPGQPYGGHSAVINPWGEVLVEGGEEAALLLVDVDPEEATLIRRDFPVLNDRRSDLYG